MKLLITSGGTKIPIDTVRHIANMSSGTFGAKIAYEGLNKGHSVDFLYAKGSKTPFTVNYNLASENPEKVLKVVEHKASEFRKYKEKYSETTYDNFSTYFSGLETLIKNTNPDVIILAAAVSDYGVDNFVDGKIRSTANDMSIKLKVLPKVISNVKKWAPNAYLVGFKLLVNSTEEELVENAKKSIQSNGCDMVVANDLRDIKNNAHQVIIVKPNVPYILYNSDPTNPNSLAEKVILHCTERTP